MTVGLSILGAALLRAASEGRLHHLGHIYRWRPRNAVTRSIGSPGISETGMQLAAFGLIAHHPGDTTCALTDRGREALAAHQERTVPVADKSKSGGRSSSSDNPGRELGRTLGEKRKEADQRGQTGRRG